MELTEEAEMTTLICLSEWFDTDTRRRLTGKDSNWHQGCNTRLQERVRANAFITLQCLITTESEKQKMGGDSLSSETTETTGKTTTISTALGTTQNETNSSTEVFTRRFYILAVFSIFTMEQVRKNVLLLTQDDCPQ